MLYAFIAIAWITCVVAAIDVFCGLSKYHRRYLSETGSGDRKENLEKLVNRVVPLPAFISFAKLSNDCVLSSSGEQFVSLVRFILGLFDNDCSKTQKFAKSTLDILCDIQVVTGTAIIIAALAQKDTITFYHQQFVMNYWFLTLNSFWAARSGDLDQNDDDDNWHYWTRSGAIFTTIVLSTYFQIFAIPLQNSQWDPVVPGYCFVYHDKSAYGQNFLWIAGLISFATYLIVVWLGGLATLILWWSNFKIFAAWILSLAHISELLPIFQWRNYAWPGWMTKTLIIMGKIARWVLRPIWWLFLQFLALWAWGDAKSPLIVAAYFGFAAWNTYDLIDLKKSNTHLVVDETVWGFGQVLPMVLLGLILLNILDAIQGQPFLCYVFEKAHISQMPGREESQPRAAICHLET